MPSFPLWEQISLPLAARSDNLDLLHCLGNTAPIFMPKSVQLVLSLMDVMFLQKGEFVPKPTNNYQAFGRIYRSIIGPRCARIAAQVITISEFSRGDILQLIPELDSDRVQVTHLSCDPVFKPVLSAITKAGEIDLAGRRPYIFSLGANDPRKNTLRVVNSYLTVLKRYAIDYDLVICGYSNFEISEAYLAVVKAQATDRVKFLPFVSILELSDLYRNATMFIYPSLYEGFGIPLLEAFSSGCPVIASNVTSIPEVGGDAAIYVNPLIEEDICEAIYGLLQNMNLRQSLIQRGYDRASAFSWAEAARQTLSIYESCKLISSKK
jgi:glycosyltransferase involved in cell wall biosynthesis